MLKKPVKLLVGAVSVTILLSGASPYYTQAEPIAVQESEDLSEIVKKALEYVKMPMYVKANPNETFMTNTEFVQTVMKESVNVYLPATISSQWQQGQSVPKASLQPGDLVFFQNSEGAVNHVGIYIGNDKMVSSRPSTGATISPLSEEAHFKGGKRVTGFTHMEIGNDIATQALALLNAPYKEGGQSEEEGFNSSGFVKYVFAQSLNLPMPRLLSEQISVGDDVARHALQPGDVIFFSSAANGSPTSAGIYIGDDKMVYPSPSAGKVVTTNVEGSTFWSTRYLKAKRITKSTPIDTNNPIINEAMNYLGIPYVFGSEDPTIGLDCSSFVQLVFEKSMNIHLPRSTDQQWQVGESVEREDLQVGDLLFFSDTYRAGISHVGIYMGHNQFIHANRSYDVSTTYLSNSYWSEKYTGARRVNNLRLPKENPIVSEATKFIGEAPYASEGTTPEGFDTAGFTQYVFKQSMNIELPRYANDQWKKGEFVEEQDLQPGDLVFFQATYLNPAIYVGNGNVVHVSPSKGVQITHYPTSSYWKTKYVGAKRIK
ncbi:C40 family peptidase [Metabacillus iocasae]|uniref:Cell wall-associated NlpC family hydrolase n=1 Tax=Priestia iocasae TaxID=2291674 RepID=A0ABS2QUA2_9BACI|nr:NlpC/P60 family protein [Metabacillus iocasae]MBM7703046.1 cell wall-associated NlpC family hydrolase [Metabacillus iocasae]